MRNSYLFIIIGLVILLVGGGTYYFQTQKTNKLSQQNTIQVQVTPTNSDAPTTSTSEDNTTSYEKMSSYKLIKKVNSPDGKYIVIEGQIPDTKVITIKDNAGKVIVEDVVSLNSTAIQNNMKKLGLTGAGQVGYSVKEWRDNNIFILDISAGPMEFVTSVNATTGKIDESTFKKI